MSGSSEFQMQQDDSTMVDDILNELNKENPVTAQVETSQQAMQPQLQIPAPNSAPMPSPLVQPEQSILNTITQGTAVVNTPISNKTVWWKVVLNQLKTPTVLAAIVYLFFNPLTRKLLSRYIPKVFQSTSLLKQHFAVLTLSLIVGISFLLTSKIL